MKVESIIPETIHVGNRMRNIDATKVVSLSQSMEAIGLLNPITVYAPDDQTLELVAGAHRLQAAIDLGWESIAAIVLTGDALHAQLAEIDENLCRANLTPAQEAEHLARRKQIWEVMQEQVGQVVPPVEVAKHGHAQSLQFAAETASVTGQAKRDINRKIKRATEVCQEARDLIRGTKLDTGTFLDRLAKGGISPKEQVDRVTDALAALADRERDDALRREAQAREQAAKEDRETAKLEACQFLFEKLTAREWAHLIATIDRAGGSLRADAMRKWEAPARAA